MHEFSLISSVIDSLENYAAEQGWKKINKVTLRIGAMRQVIPATMQFAFKTACDGTLLEGAELELVDVPIIVCCPRCGHSWGEEHMGMICPYCGCDDAQMSQGMELEIDSVEVEDDGEEKD